MNVYRRELKNYRKATIVWTVSLSTLAVVFLLMFPAFTKDVEASRNILANLPPAIRDSFGITLATFFTIAGFYSYLLTFAILAAAVQATNLGVGVISKEESEKTADFLLTKPISRQSVITSKLLAALTLLVATNIIFVSVSYIAASIVSTEDFSSKSFLLIAATVFLVQLAFLSIGALLAVIIPKVKSVIAVSIPVVFGFFVIGTIGEIVGNQDVRYVTPFKFFDTNHIISYGSYETRFILLEITLIVLTLLACYGIYIKKDIRAAA